MIGNVTQARSSTSLAVSSAPPRARGGVRAGLLMGAIFALALFLRAYGIERLPFRYETTDEYHYMWVGLTLLHTGHAMSWSELGVYEPIGALYGRTTWDGLAWRIVTPALDHPPLYSLVAGVFAQLAGATPGQATFTGGRTHAMWHINLRRARLCNLLLFALTFFLMFDLGRRVFGFGPACLAMLFYATSSHVVLHNRLLVTESLSTPLLLLNLCLLQRYLAGECRERLFGAGTVLACVAAVLIKLVAACQAGVILFLLLVTGRRREVIYPIVGVILGAALYLAYGAWQGWAVFWAVLHAQGARFFGLDAIIRMIVTPMLVHTADFSYPLFLGWVACFIFTMRGIHGPERLEDGTWVAGTQLDVAPLLASPLLYLLWFSFFAAVPVIFGWHLLPFYPFLCLGLAALLAAIWQRADRLGFAVIMSLLLPYVFHLFFINNTGAKGVIRWAYLAAASAAVLYSFAPGRMGVKVMRLSIAGAVSVIVISETCKVLMITFM